MKQRAFVSAHTELVAMADIANSANSKPHFKALLSVSAQRERTFERKHPISVFKVTIFSGLPRVRESQGKTKFSPGQGILRKCQGILPI